MARSVDAGAVDSAAARAADGVSPARACAYTVVRRVFEQGAYADRAFAAEADGLEPRERSFAMALSYATVQRRATLDHLLGHLAGRAPERLEPPLLAVLRLGVAQLVLLDGVADHAAVDESVRLAKRDAPRGAGLVNAVLRRATREARELLAALDDSTPERAAILHSVPEWLARLWFSELGAHEARTLLAAINLPAESALRVNTLVATPAAVAGQLSVPARPAVGVPEALVLDGPFDAYRSPLWREGAIMPQSRGSMTPARVLDPQPGDAVLDLCAAPGAKTTQLAALIEDRGELLSVERNPARADGLRRTLARMHVTCATVEIADASGSLAPGRRFDRVLIDPPCSGLGTLQSRPDLRWRATPERIAGTAALGARILDAAAVVIRSQGTLVYSVCTISKAEGEDVISRFLAHNGDFTLERFPGCNPQTSHLQLMPHSDGTDGFFVARLHRR